MKTNGTEKKDIIRWGIRWKLISTVMSLMLCFLAILTCSQVSSQKKLMEDELSRRISLMKDNLIADGKNITIHLTQQVEQNIASYNFSGLLETVNQSVKNNKDMMYAILMDSSNTVFVHTLKPSLARTQLNGEQWNVDIVQNEMIVRESKEGEESFIEIISPVQISTEPWGSLRLFFTMKNLDEEIKESIKQIAYERNRMIHKAVLSSSGFLLISFIIVLILSGKILKPLILLTCSVRELSKGDFSRSIEMEINRNDEIGQLLSDVGNMVERLRAMIKGISETSVRVDSFSGEILTAVENQAVIATQQSASVSEISSTMMELSSSSTQIASHSESVVKIADHALRNTKQGAESVEDIMVKMNEINIDNQKNIQQISELGKKSEDIAKIMEIINSISDQTKLIAFNAALEASSAGDAGKRFSVVAAEIRRLAGNVTESTGDIEYKVNEIQEAVNQIIINSERGSKRIKEGLEYSDRTAEKLRDIVQSVSSATDAAKQISLSIQQQKTANEQVVISLKDIEQGASQTLNAIRHISCISKDMKTLSDNLQEMMKKFKLSRVD